MRHKGFTWWEAIILIAVILVLAAILFPVFFSRRHPGRPSAMCQSNLKQIGLAFLQYTQDNDKEALPRIVRLSVSIPEKKKFYGWADAIQPYLKSTQLYQCRSEDKTYPSDDPMKSGYIDYWMNAKLSDLSLASFESIAQTLLCGDGNDGSDLTNARYNINALPQKWIDDKSSPPYRHLETANYLFADGHVKAMKVENIKPSPKNGPSFAIK